MPRPYSLVCCVALGLVSWAMFICPVGDEMGWEAVFCEGSDVGGKTLFSVGIVIEMHMKNVNISINIIQKGAD